MSAFGAALSGTIASSSERANRAELIALRAADAKSQEEAQIRGEDRREASAIRGEDRARENLKKDRADNLKYFLDQGVNIFSQGKDSASRAADKKKLSAFAQEFAQMMSGNHPRYKGNAPVSVFEDSPMARNASDPRDKPEDKQKYPMMREAFNQRRNASDPRTNR